ncbi:MAG: NAD+ synthase [Phycisphaeraceae bacterium]
MRIALAQINPTVGDIAGNMTKIIGDIDRAAEAEADLVVFPELAVVGYPPKDLLLKPDLIDQCEAAMKRIASHCRGITAVVGYPARSTQTAGRELYNAAAVCRDGRIIHTHLKHLLPTYDVFDETRYFEPGPKLDLATLEGTKLGISVCEDLWNDREIFSRQLYHDNPIDELAQLGAQLFINCSASPFVLEKRTFRLNLLTHTAKRYGIPIVYVNQVGGNDELIFDGNSCIIDAEGEVVAHARAFEEDLLVADLPQLGYPPTPPTAARPDTCGGVSWDASPPPVSNRIEPAPEGLAELYHALRLGLADYCKKCGFKSLVVGLSGGIDSALTAAIAVGALGAENVTGIAMPSRYSSEHSISDARELAEKLGIAFHLVPIDEAHAAMERSLAPVFEGTEPGVAEENIQARLRGNILMAYSNKFNAMLVTTGNKSEMAVGYCTLYGDMAGGLAVLSDVPKMLCYDLSRYLNTAESPLVKQLGHAPIPEASITKPPSAELRPDQRDQDSLPTYDELDAIILRYIEHLQPVTQIVEETGFAAATVERICALIDRNEYKRKQAAPGLKVTSRAFGFGRRMPMAQRFDPTAKL